ncbi:MAG: YncE family protein, partial [bacterium]
MKFNTVVILTLLLSILCSACRLKEKEIYVLSTPAGNTFTQIDKEGKTVIPNGRFITPLGKSIQVAPHPYGLTLSRDGNIAITANSGTQPLSISIIRNLLSEQPEVQQIPPGPSTDKGVLASVFMGLAISPDNKLVYVAGGQENKVFLFDLATGNKIGFIDCNFSSQEIEYLNGYIGDLVLSQDGRSLYAVDQMNFRMIILDTEKREIKHNVPVGRYPFGIALSPDGKKVYVANVGMFTYKKISGIDEHNLKDTALKFPPFAYLSSEARDGIKIDSLEVSGLGEPNVPAAFSVWTISLENPESPAVIAKTKTGHLVGEMIAGIPAVGGSSPNSLVATSN